MFVEFMFKFLRMPSWYLFVSLVRLTSDLFLKYEQIQGQK